MQKQQLLHCAEDRHVFVSETDKTPAKEFDIFMHATLFQFSVLKYVNTMSQWYYIPSKQWRQDENNMHSVLCNYLTYCLKNPNY